jgi:integrase
MIGKLSARKVETAKPGKYADGGGLYLAVAPSGAKKWTFRFRWKGANGVQAREAGLGSVHAVTLADARGKADVYRSLVAKGVDPIKNARKAVEAEIPSFGEIADELIAAKESEWRNAKHRDQWKMTLTKYAGPLRSTPVDQVDTAAVLAVLKPLWQAKPETASRLRGRIEHVLDAARAKGHRSGENPARWRGHLDKLLPRRTVLSRGHHAALPYDDVSAFVDRLRKLQTDSTAARAIEFAILTAARKGEVLGARWEEFDLDKNVWTIPATRTKAGRQHRVPLCDRAIAILKTMIPAPDDKTASPVSDGRSFVFPGTKRGTSLSNMAMDMVLRRLEESCTVHGFRSSFRDWAGNETSFAREIAEAALAHVVGDKAEQAYRRGDALAKRRELMAAWASFCELTSADKVVPIRRPNSLGQ